MKIIKVLLISFLFVSGSFSASFAGNEETPRAKVPGEGVSKEEFKVFKKEFFKLKKSYRQLNNRIKKKPQTDFDIPKLQIRGFGHLQYDAVADKTVARNGSSNNFANGGMVLFISSRISSKLTFLNETVFEFGENGANILDVERVLLKYDYADWLSIAIGRGHTGLGYWNQRFHHGSWLFTTIERPILYNFEDDGGILPVHYVGLEFSGSLDTGFGDLSYIANVANGRGRITDEVQLIEDDNDSKMLNLMLTFEPEALPGLGFGFNITGDTIPNNPGAGRAVEQDERIYGAHLFYVDDEIEFIGEYQHIEHSLGTGYTNTGGYLQFAYTFMDVVKPYYRYDFIQIDIADSFFTETGAESTNIHTLGVRYEWFPFAALKVEYRNKDATSISSHEGSAQISFAF